jgi:hypothetical protein
MGLYFAPRIEFQFGAVVIASTTELGGWRSDASGPFFYESTRDTLLASGSRRSSHRFERDHVLAAARLRVRLSGAIHQAVEAPTLENNIEKYGVIGIREFRGRRCRLPNPHVTGVIAKTALIRTSKVSGRRRARLALASDEY